MDTATLLFDRYRRRGDLDALGRAFDLLSPRLLALALHLTGNAADAEDVLQATFVVAMQKAAAFDSQKEVGPWLAGVLAGEANNLRRREQRRRTEALEEALVGDATGDVVGDAERRELVAQLRTRIDALPDEQRQVLLLQLQHGLRPAEIAEVLGIAPGTVRMRLHRGLETLRRVLPAGLLALLVAGTARRGLAAVREAVLQAGAQNVLVASGGVAAATIGAVMLKKILVACGVLAASLLLWRSLTAPEVVVAPTPSASGALAAVGELSGEQAPPSVPDEAAVVEREPATPTAVASAPASLQVTVRGFGPHGDDPMVVDLLIPDSADAPALPGVVVELGPQASSKPRSYDPRWQRCAADRAGICTFTGLVAGSYLVDIEGGGSLARERIDLAPGETAAVELLVELAGTVRGRVVDVDGRAVGGAGLWVGGRLDSYSEPEKRLRLAASSDADGRFAVPFRRQEEFVSARCTGLVASRSHPLQQLGDDEIVLVLGHDPAALRGVLVDEVGQPVAGAVVSIEPTDVSFQQLRRDAHGALVGPRLGLMQRSDEHGGFAFDGLPADAFQLRAVRPPNQTAEQVLRLKAGEHRELRLSMPRRAVVAGRVVRSDARPCAQVYVSLAYGDGSSHTDITDERGDFVFAGVRLQPFELVARRGGSERMARRAMPAPTTDGVEVELVYDDAPSLFGTVQAANGLRLGGWFVSIGEGAETRREPTDAEGRFRICDVAPGQHVLRVHRLAEQSTTPAMTATVVADVAAELRVPLEAMPFGEVRGRVVGPDGSALPEMSIDLPYAGSKQGSVTGDGSFRMAMLLPGTHWLRVMAPDHVVSLQAVSVGEREIVELGTLAMVRSAVLRVRYQPPAGMTWRARPPKPFLKQANGEFLTEPEGVRYSIDGDEVVAIGVAPGTYTVHGRIDDELLMAPTTVTLVAGEQRRVTIPLTLGRRRTFAIGELAEFADADGRVQVVVRGVDAAVLFDELLRLDEGAVQTTLVVPVGTVTIEAHAGERVVARRTLKVGPELAEVGRIDVPRVR